MTSDILPDDVKQFLLKHIDSIAQWEGLLLARSRPQAALSRESIAQSLYVTEAEAAQLLAHLQAHGFLSVSGAKPNQIYSYKPKSEDITEMIDRIAELYKQYLIPITHFIHSKSKSRIQEFADAFRIRKD